MKSKNDKKTSKIIANASEKLLSLNITLGFVIEFEKELNKLVDDFCLEAKFLKATMVIGGKNERVVCCN